jgi:hypothetical protein
VEARQKELVRREHSGRIAMKPDVRVHWRVVQIFRFVNEVAFFVAVRDGPPAGARRSAEPDLSAGARPVWLGVLLSSHSGVVNRGGKVGTEALVRGVVHKN